MRVLITGVTGFVGSHLAEYLLTLKGVQVFGIARPTSKPDNLKSIRERIELLPGDLDSARAVRSVLEEVRPDRIFHLAAVSSVPFSLAEPRQTMMTNIVGELNILEVAREMNENPRIHVSGSSEEYGRVLPEESPLSESAVLRPLNPYAVSKVAQDLLGYQYHQSYRLHVVRTRAFNHTGSRQRPEYASSNFARQIARIEARLEEPVIYVGNLESVRDFTDVRDIVKAYWLALEKGQAGEVYNVCSGKGRRIREILELLLKYSSARIEVRSDPRRFRPSEVPVMVGDGTKFRKATGWRPLISLETTLRDLLNYWREQIELETPSAKN